MGIKAVSRRLWLMRCPCRNPVISRRVRPLPVDEVDGNSHSQRGVVRVHLWWPRMNNVSDIELLFQPRFPVCVDRKARDKPLGCAEVASRDTTARHPPSTIYGAALQAMIQTEAVEYTKPGGEDGVPPFWGENQITFSAVYDLFPVAGHPVNAQILEHSPLLFHLRVEERHVATSVVKL